MSRIQLQTSFFQQYSKAVLIVNKEKKIISANKALYQLLKYEENELMGKIIDTLSERSKDRSYKKMWECVEKNGIWEGQIWNKRKNGELFLEQRTIMKTEDGSYIFIMEEVNQGLEKANIKDYVTKLPSRRFFQRNMQKLLKKSKNENKKLMIMMINIERFQELDKTFGFTARDEILRKVSERILECLGKDDVLCRMAGGLFSMVTYRKPEQAFGTFIEQLLKRFKQEAFLIQKKEIYIPLSIGISCFPEDGEDERDLLRNADFARYQASETGDNHYQFYTPDLNVKMFERLVLENHLRKALEKKEFVLYYQPQIDLETRKIVGVESLIRWNHPEFGLVPPIKFVGIAEETGLINEMGIWALEEACKQNKKWQDMGYAPIVMSVNLSLKQLHQANFTESVREVLRKTGLDAKWLELEITESMVMHSVDKVIYILNELRTMGMTVAIDDFGTGYSSLSYLAKLPVNTLKIDRSFVDAINTEEGETIISIVLSMAKKLKLDVVAEGAETEQQVSFLQEQECEMYQGYHFSPPVTAEVITEMLHKQKTT